MGQIIPVQQAMRGQRVYIDTNVFIYFLEGNPQFLPAAAPVMQAIDNNDFRGFTGEVTVAETMVGPYRKNDSASIATIRDFFYSKNFVTLLPHGRAIFDHAARLRAHERLRFIDAIHLATAMAATCKFFITNDKAIRTKGNIAIVQLDTLQP
ncbi:MAG: PIN domain-containing protein [Duganella sp.]